MSTEKLIIKNSLIVISNTLFTNFIAFLTTLIFIRFLGVTEFGMLTLALSAISLIEMIIDFGISGVLISDIAVEIGKKKYGAVKSLILRFSQMQLLLAGILFLITFLFSSDLAGFFPVIQNITTILKLISFMLLIFAVKNIFIVCFNSHSKFNYLTLLQSGDSLSRLGLICIFFFIFHIRTIEFVILAYIIAGLVSIFISAPFFIKTLYYLKNTPRIKANLFINLIKGHGKYNVIIGQIKNLQVNLPYWIINLILGINAVAIYSTAVKLQYFFLIIIDAIDMIFAPLIASIITTKEKVKIIYKKISKYGLWLSILMLILAFTVVPTAAIIFFGSKYIESIPVFLILILILPFGAINISIRPIYFAYKEQKTLTKVYIFSLLLMLFLMYIFIIPFGLIGIAIGYLVATSLDFLIRRHILKIKYLISIDTKEFFRFDKYDSKILKKVINKITIRSMFSKNK
ncbi:MAG: oligosaccharide flippase family protein [Candidatus Diapherotrites archaeon]